MKNAVSTWCRHSRNGPITYWFAVLALLHYILTQPSLVSLPVLTHPQKSLAVIRLLRHPYPYLDILRHPYPYFDILRHPYTYLSILTSN